MPVLPGGVPERPKGTGCKPVGSAYGGSNPPAPIQALSMFRSRNWTWRELNNVMPEAAQNTVGEFR